MIVTLNLSCVFNIDLLLFMKFLVSIIFKFKFSFDDPLFCAFFVPIFTNKPAHNIPRTFPESPLKVLTSGTYRAPSGDSQGTNTKIDDLMKNLFFLKQ